MFFRQDILQSHYNACMIRIKLTRVFRFLEFVTEKHYEKLGNWGRKRMRRIKEESGKTLEFSILFIQQYLVKSYTLIFQSLTSDSLQLVYYT